MNKYCFQKTLLAMFASFFISACGGGGGDNPPTPTPSSSVSPIKSSTCRTMSGETQDASSNQTCFDWSSNETLDYFVLLSKKMIEKYGIDGWRFDQAYQVPLDKWKDIGRAIRTQADASSTLGFTVAEVWDGDGSSIEKTVLKNGSLDSAFNFPLRYKLVQVIAGQESDSPYGAFLQPAASLADEWGYGNYIRYQNKNVMPTMFFDNHDLVRLGNLLFRWNLVDESEVSSNEYSLRHLLAFAFEASYSGPIAIYYGNEYGDYTVGYAKQPTNCGTGNNWCDDHVSRTQAVSEVSDLSDWQKKLREKVADLMLFRSETPAMFNGSRYHIYSTETAPVSETSPNFYVDVKKDTLGNAYVFAMSTSSLDRSLVMDETVSEYLCEKAVESSNCKLDLVIDTTVDNVSNPVAESFGGNLVFNLPAFGAKIYKVTSDSAPSITSKYTVTNATSVSPKAALFDDKINSFTCFKGENTDKCGLIIYQVMVESSVNGIDAAGKGIGWGPSEHKGTLGGIESMLDFIEGVHANALWVTPVFYTANPSGEAEKKTAATGYYATSHYLGDKANIDADFGGENSFISLINAVHSKGMYFILDGVFGHASSSLNKNETYINIEE